MTKTDTWEILEFVVANTLAQAYPELDRQTLRGNVRAVMQTLHSGLMAAVVCGMTGELTECTNLYEVRTP
jgi:hypothetical protein